MPLLEKNPLPQPPMAIFKTEKTWDREIIHSSRRRGTGVTAHFDSPSTTEETGKVELLRASPSTCPPFVDCRIEDDFDLSTHLRRGKPHLTGLTIDLTTLGDRAPEV